MLYVGRTRYRGPVRTFADGTSLAPGDPYGSLHFDNSRIASLGEVSLNRSGVRFARLLRDSLSALVDASRNDPALADLPAFHGVTWIRDHGAQVGFVSEGPEAEKSGVGFDTSLRGNSNAGHTYGADLPAADREALIEYLKTL